MKKNKLNKIELTINLINKYYETKNIHAINKLIKYSKIDLINKCLIQIDDPAVILFLLMAINKNKTSTIYRYLPNEIQDKILDVATNSQVKIIFSELFPDEIFDIANRNKENFKKVILNISSEQRELIKKIDKFENDEAGSIMNPEFLVFQNTWTIKMCLNKFKEQFKNIEEHTVFYVCSSDNKIMGRVNIHDLIFCKNYSKKISSIMNESFLSVYQDDDIENVIDIFENYHLENVPVINKKNQIVGIINNIDILPAIQEEVTEDIYKMYGIQKTDESYIKSSIWKIVKSRLLWVVVLMISATLTSIAISLFENLGTKLTAGLSTILLVPIIPVITGTSGNTGSQSLATTIRLLSIGEVTPKEYKNIVLKELKIAFLLGFFLSITNLARLCLYFAVPSFRQNNGETVPYIETFYISLASSAALWLAIILAKLLGSSLPIIAIKFNRDPTIMCGPLISTFLDLSSTSLLFGIGIGIIQLI